MAASKLSSVVTMSAAAAAAASYTATNNHSFADGPSTSSYFKFNPFSSNSSQPTPKEPITDSSGSGSDPQPGVDVSKRGFDDPEALEKAAKYLRKINNSPYKSLVFEVMRKQEENRLLELEAEKAHFEALQSLNDIEKRRKWAEEQREVYQQQAQAKAQMLRNEDELKRKRMLDANEAQRRNNAELVQMQEVANIRKENARRATEEQIQAQLIKTEKQKAEIERETIRDTAMAIAEAKAHGARLEEEINRRELLQKANGEKEKWLAAINTTFSHIEGGFRILLTDKTTLLMAVGGTTALAAGIYTTREGSRVTWGYINRMLGQPSLIRESSVAKYPWSGIGSRVANKIRYSTAAGGGADAQRKSVLQDVVLHPSLQKRIEHLARATSNTKIHQAPFRNMLFYGPPGTGKTMVAKEIAKKSGLDYAMMTGGDVAPLGPQAVTKIHEIFDWSKNSKKGLLLFIDEADAFLCQRNSTHMSEAQRSALNALLFRTGDQSRDVVLVLATNRPSDLDTAVTDRIDEVIEFPLPREEERFHLLKLYMDKYLYGKDVKETRWAHLFKKKSPQKITVKDISDEVLREAAKKTEGFSGREIAKLMAGVQASVYGRPDCVLDPELFKEIVDYKVTEHGQRVRLAGEAA